MLDAAASTATRPNVRDDGQRPSERDGITRVCSGDLPDGERGIFLRKGLDRNLLICPSSKVMTVERCYFAMIRPAAKPASPLVSVRNNARSRSERDALLEISARQ